MKPLETQRIADELLVLDALAGDRAAFQKLAERWQERLWQHARRITQRDDLAWDVSQEAWLAIAETLDKLSDTRRFGSWALSIVTRRALDRLRSAARTEPLEAPEAVLGDAQDPRGEECEGSVVAALRWALSHLPPDQRALLALHHVEGLALADLAAAMGVPVGTVKSRLFSARESLRAQLETYDR